MSKFVIGGGNPLKGEVRIAGSKNAVLPILAATLLTDQDCEIRNIPKISDVDTMLGILKALGAQIEREPDRVYINTKKVKSWSPPDNLVAKMRASILLIGPLLARFGKVEIAAPGGCQIGSRRVDTHLKAFRALGAKVSKEGGRLELSASRLRGDRVILEEMSVTATENVLMAASLAFGDSEIRLAAIEPHVVDLTKFLAKMGAKVKGVGSHSLYVSGSNKKLLGSASHQVTPDMVEAATYILAGAVTEGAVEVFRTNPGHLDIFLSKLRQAGVSFELGQDWVRIFPSKKIKPVYIKTDCYPGFATDFQAPFTVLLTKAQGTSIVFETMYEGRLNYIPALVKMGAKAKIIDPHKMEIEGPGKLKGAKNTSFDLRAGATLVLAALAAEGKSEINKIELIDRGYENIENKLKALGANIKRVN